MPIIEPAPNIKEININFQEMSLSPLVQHAIQIANRDYLYWDKFKYRVKAQSGLTQEEIWCYLKTIRTANQNHSPIFDKEGKRFLYWIPDSMLKALSDIDRSSGTVLVAGEPEPFPRKEQYIISSLMEEAIASSQLEGASTTRKVAKDMLRSGRKPRDINEQMILNNWLIIQHLREKKSDELTPEFIKEMHAIITDKTLKNPTDCGRFRETDDYHVYYNNEIVHTPIKAKNLSDRMKAFCQFANQNKKNDDDQWIHPVIKGIMLHFWFAYDHPFADGNGRTARAIFYWYLISHGYYLFEFLAISRFLLRAPGQYVRAYVYAEADDNDLTYFISYNLRAIRYAIDDLKSYINRKQQEMILANDLLKKYSDINYRQKNLIYHALRHPEAIFNIEIHKNTHGTAYDTARNDLLDLEKRGFLEKRKQGKSFVFAPSTRMIQKLKRNNI